MMVPPFTNSAMDGFAIWSASTQGVKQHEVELRVTGEVQAGSLSPGTIGVGEAFRIMTGAPMPSGADSVVPFEEARTEGDSVYVLADRHAGACVRPAGLDITEGQTVLESGMRLGPRQIALAASIGTAKATVYKRPVVAILATGDELVEPGSPLQPGQIYNSNAHGLAAAVRELGATPQLLTPARDDFESLRTVLASIEGVDLILTSGGVSVGDYDYVKQVIEELGDVSFWRIRVRPGKPLMLGSLPSKSSDGRTMVIGLPGNPTSTMVTFHIFARPVILKLMGDPSPLPTPLWAVTHDALDNSGDRETYFRVRMENNSGQLGVRLAGHQDSSLLLPLAHADALARVPADVDSVEPGGQVEVFPLD